MLVELIREGLTKQALVYIALNPEELEKDGLANKALSTAVENSHLDIVKKLLEHPEKIDDNCYDIAMIMAICNNDLNIFEMLVKYSENIKNNYHVVVRFAIDTGHIDFVKKLLKYPDKIDYSILVNSAMDGHFDIVKKLLEYLDKIPESSYGSAFINALTHGHLDIAKRLLKHPEKITNEYYKLAFRAAAEEGHKGIIEKMLAYPEKIYHHICGYGVAFVCAARNGHLDVVEVLWNKYPEKIFKDDYGWALKGAASNGYLDIIVWLLKQPEKIFKEDYGDAFELAAKNGHIDIVMYLAKIGTDLHEDVNFGESFDEAIALYRNVELFDKVISGDSAARISWANGVRELTEEHAELLNILTERFVSRLASGKIEDQESLNNLPHEYQDIFKNKLSEKKEELKAAWNKLKEVKAQNYDDELDPDKEFNPVIFNYVSYDEEIVREFINSYLKYKALLPETESLIKADLEKLLFNIEKAHQINDELHAYSLIADYAGISNDPDEPLYLYASLMFLFGSSEDAQATWMVGREEYYAKIKEEMGSLTKVREAMNAMLASNPEILEHLQGIFSLNLEGRVVTEPGYRHFQKAISIIENIELDSAIEYAAEMFEKAEAESVVGLADSDLEAVASFNKVPELQVHHAEVTAMGTGAAAGY